MWTDPVVRALPLALLSAACSPLVGTYPDRADYPVEQASQLSDAPQDPETLRVMTWNVKFGGARVDFWFDGWGDRVHMTEAEAEANLAALVDLVNEVQPDILLTQEVDRHSKRSAYLDQVQALLEDTDLNYGAWVPVWEAAYVPTEGLGPMEMGQAVFSRYPITRNTRIALPPVSDQAPHVRLFYLDRCIQHVTVDLGTTDLQVLNNHPEAYATDGTKQRQLEITFDEAQGLSAPLLVGGDFNSVPPGTHNLSDFADNAPVDTPGVEVVTYEEEGDQLLADYYAAWNAAIPLESYQVEDQAPFFTHSISAEVFWNRKLDYLFSTGAWTGGQTIQAPGDAGVTLDPMALSDHAPVFGVLEVSP